mgnify:CR=1 FL=1
MARYDVKFIDATNVSRAIEVVANDNKEAERIARKKGRVVSVKRKVGLDLTPGMSAADRYTFMVRLSTMLGSKVGLSESLKIIAQTFSGAIRKCSAGMLARVEAGADLAGAMEGDRKNFPSTTTALVRAGQATGNSWKSLREAAEFEHRLLTLRKASMKEVWQAMGAFIIAGALMIATTEYFSPMVMGNSMFKNSNHVDVGWIETVGNWLTVTMIVMLVIGGGFFLLGSVGRQIVPDAADRLILKIPYYRDLILSRNNYVTFYKLGLLITSGVRVEEALRLTEDTCPRGALKSDLQRAVRAVQRGRGGAWAADMQTIHATDKAALMSSSDREDVARTLNILGEQYQALYIQRVNSFGPALNLVAALFMSLASAVLFGLTILPMLQLSAGLSK